MNLNLSLADLTRIVQGVLLQGGPRQVLESVSIDTRTLESGQFFIALKGERTDGHLHLQAAHREGAGGFIVSQDRIPDPIKDHPETAVILVKDTLKALQDLAQSHRIRYDVPVAAVTGSNGKTTTKEMLASILRQRGEVLATPGNFNNQIGLPLTLLELDSRHKTCVLEMGASQLGQIHRLCEIARPLYGIITNIGRAHLESFGSLSNVARAKWELVQHLPAEGHGVVPAEEIALNPFRNTARCRLTLFGETAGPDVGAQDIEEEEGLEFTLILGSERGRVRLPIPGRFNVFNALAASACAWRMGAGFENIRMGLESFSPAPMRMSIVRHPSGAILVNDAYNANPDSMRASLESFCRQFKGGERIAVLGGMLELGPEGPELHRALGEFMAGLPLTEVHLLGPESKPIYEGALKAGVKSLFFHESIDPIRQALASRLHSGVAVLFKASRGIHLEDLIREL